VVLKTPLSRPNALFSIFLFCCSCFEATMAECLATSGCTPLLPRSTAQLDKRASPEPAAFALQPSRAYQGNDGNWSTFYINAGTPPQQFSVLISTSALGTWLVDANACSTSRDPTAAQHPDCLKLRGSTAGTGWSSKDSTTYKALGQYGLELNNDLPLASTFAASPVSVNYTGASYASNATLGRDAIQMLSNDGKGSPMTSNDTLVYSMLDPSFFLSTLGIGHGDTQLDNDPSRYPSMLALLANQTLIPSKSWGYTAGAYYNQTIASLVFGGYDSARMKNPTSSFLMTPIRGGKGTPQLQVSVTSMTLNADGTSTSITKTGDSTTTFPAILDSSLPYLSLPSSICEKIADQLSLRYDSRSDLYFPTSSTKAYTSLDILLSSPSNSKTSHQITLPSASLSQTLTWPIFDDPVPYFPLRRAPANAPAILGRVLFQEAYVVADFERGNFTIADAVSPPNTLQTLVPIVSPLISESSKLGAGPIAGIVVGALAGVGGLIALMFFLIRRRRKAAPAPEVEHTVVEETKEDEVTAHFPSGVTELDSHGRSRHLSELSGSEEVWGTPVGTVVELADKTDVVAWRENQERMQRTDVRYELDGRDVSRSEMSA